MGQLLLRSNQLLLCGNAHCCLIFQNEIRDPDFFFFLHEMSWCLKHYGPKKVCRCLQDEFACKTTSLWSLDLEHLYSAVHNKIWTHTLTHPPIHIRTPLYLQYCLMKIKEAFSLSLWTLWIFSVFLKWIVRC